MTFSIITMVKFFKLHLTQFLDFIFLVSLRQIIKFNRKMSSSSQAYASAKAAFQKQFPTRNLPQYSRGQSIFDLIHVITCQTSLPINYLNAIEHMKAASDSQEYKIQRSWLQIQKEVGLASLQQLCYEMHSTGLLNQKEVFLSISEKASSQLGDCMNNLIDEVWWNADKKSEQHLYFLD